tara:strand:- start:11352 stop:12278 length:927 start_codon:yes stop_codon:yes gene_type:complete
MIRQPISNRRRWILGILSVIILLGGYTWLSHRQHVKNPKDVTIPSWSQLAEGWQKITRINPRIIEQRERYVTIKERRYDVLEGETVEQAQARWQAEAEEKYEGEIPLIADSYATFRRFLIALAATTVISFVLGIGMGGFRSIDALFTPSLTFIGKIPPTASLAVFFAILGTSENLYTGLIIFGTLPILATSVMLVAQAVPSEEINKAYTIGASHAEVIWNVIVRQVFPSFLDAVRLTIGPIMVYLIAAEMLAADAGMGYRIRLQLKITEMDVTYIYLVVLAAFGFGMDLALRLTQRICCPWFKEGAKP